MSNNEQVERLNKFMEAVQGGARVFAEPKTAARVRPFLKVEDNDLLPSGTLFAVPPIEFELEMPPLTARW